VIDKCVKKNFSFTNSELRSMINLKIMNQETIKVGVCDVMSDFYNEVMKKRFDDIETQLADVRLSTIALVKIVDYARLEAKLIELEVRLKKLEIH